MEQAERECRADVDRLTQMDMRDALIEIVFLLRDIKDSLNKPPSNSKPTVKGGEG